jgi:hypothetical protein
MILLTTINVAPVFAQTAAAAVDPIAAIKWPQWSRDLRRFDIVAFGAYPLAYLFSSIGYDTARWAKNGMDRTYAPWPAKPANAVAWKNGDYTNVMLIAGGVSLGIAAVDLTIVLIRRNKRAKELEARGRARSQITIQPLGAPPPPAVFFENEAGQSALSETPEEGGGEGEAPVETSAPPVAPVDAAAGAPAGAQPSP